jgi:hypothetical protein
VNGRRGVILGTCLWIGVVCLVTSATPVPVVLAQRAKPAAPAPPDNAACLACHDDPALVSESGQKVGVDVKKFGSSVHGALDIACVECHADLRTTDEFPHAPKLAKAQCAGCHDDAVGKYNLSVHAQSRRDSPTSLAAACVDCHTGHETRSSKDPASTTYPLNLPTTCSRCHGDPAVIRKGNIKAGDVASQYKDSIHGRAVSKSGLLVAANCTSCHGSHEIRTKSDPLSQVHRTSVPATCGTCHEGIKAQYADSVHGAALAAGKEGAPMCADCHSAHRIQRATAPSWQLDVIQECGTCHVKNIRTYRDTFHGQVTSLGFVRVATCASCHGSHATQPSGDSRSMTSPERILSTCQQCHQNATEGFTKYDPHADKHDPDRNPMLYRASTFMTWLLVGTFGFFGLHAALWLPRGLAHRRRARAAASDQDGPADPQ